MNDNAVPSVLMGFNLDRSSLENELALIKAVYEKYLSEVITGTVAPEEIVPEMIEEMNAVGLQKVKDEFQRQVDAAFAE